MVVDIHTHTHTHSICLVIPTNNTGLRPSTTSKKGTPVCSELLTSPSWLAHDDE